MPKVLRIINRLNLGGPTYNASYLSKHLAPEFETMLLAGMKDDTEASSAFIPESMGLKPMYVENMHREINFSNDRKAYKEIKKIIEDFKPDIVHTHAAKSGALGRLAAHNCNVPVILHTFHGHVFHSYFGKLKTNFFIQAERFLARRSTKIVAISNIQKKELVEQFKIAKEDKVQVVPLGFDLSRFQQNIESKRESFRAKYQIEDDEIAIGIVGRLVPIKDHKLFLDSISILLKQITKKVKAIIIGDGELREELENYTKQLNITKEVVFTGWMKDVDVAYAGLDIVALSSLNEGTPVSLIEAQATNKPIVTTNVGGIADIVVENETALLCMKRDAVEYANLLSKLVEDDEYRMQVGKQGNQHVMLKFSYQRLVEDMRNLYNSLLP